MPETPPTDELVAGADPLTSAQLDYWTGYVAGCKRVLDLIDASPRPNQEDRKRCKVILAVDARLRFLEEQEAVWDQDHWYIRTCRVCGCTDRDCSACVEKTGQPCWWAEPDLCSACVEEVKTS